MSAPARPEAAAAGAVEREAFLDHLAAAVEGESLVRLSLGHSRDAALRKWLVRPVEIRGERRFTIVWRYANRDETKHFPPGELLERVGKALEEPFRSAHLVTRENEVTLELGKRPRLRIAEAAHPAPILRHDRSKPRGVSPQAPYLRLLGVSDAQGRVRERMGDKFRQVARFVDLLGVAAAEALTGQGEGNLTLCDMGSGKGYLTFAAYDYLTRGLGRRVEATGVEQREELVVFCNTTAAAVGFDGLRFVAGTIDSAPLPPRLDLLIALHACDTATDDAIAAGVRAGAAVLMVAPCCQKEVRPQLDAAVATSPLRDVLRHGLFAERHAEMATDALRVLLLERAGYRVRVAEFVSPEHTARNVLLLATRQPGGAADAGFAERIAALKAFYGIRRHRLETLLA